MRNREEYIDFLNKEISKYISRMLVKERNPKDSQYMSVLFKVCGNLERIGDHAMNICEYTNMIQEKQISFSAEVIKQIGQMKEVCNQALDMVLGVEQNGGDIKEIEQIEQKIDDMTEDFRKRQIDRMQTGACSDEGCVLYSEMLTDFERLGDAHPEHRSGNRPSAPSATRQAEPAPNSRRHDAAPNSRARELCQSK